ncbi:MAG: BglII/BstYI family type II restriction endonuclease [Ruthenibacterium lactatiformans]
MSSKGGTYQFGHASFLGTDLLKFQMASYSNLDFIDFGVYITTTKAMQKFLTVDCKMKLDT